MRNSGLVLQVAGCLISRVLRIADSDHGVQGIGIAGDSLHVVPFYRCSTSSHDGIAWRGSFILMAGWKRGIGPGFRAAVPLAPMLQAEGGRRVAAPPGTSVRPWSGLSVTRTSI